MSLVLYLPLGISIVLCSVTSALLCRYFISRSTLLDEVSDRSSHQVATPRVGGVAVLLPFTVVTAICLMVTGQWDEQVAVLLGLGALAGGLGLVDDVFAMRAALKFAGQAIIAVLLVFLVGEIETVPIPFLGAMETGNFGFALSVLWVVAFINVYNFMDGLNGIAGGVAIIALLAMALMASAVNRIEIFLICICLAAAILGFLRFNFSAGQIFLGDAGSHGIGFLLAGLALVASKPLDPIVSDIGIVPFVFLPIVFLPFIMDVVVTLISRTMRRQPLHQAHKEHIYQRLQQNGFTHSHVAMIYMGMTFFAAATAWIVSYVPPAMQWLGPFMLACFFAAAGLSFFSREAKKSGPTSGSSGD